jgi:hypothetical protein
MMIVVVLAILYTVHPWLFLVVEVLSIVFKASRREARRSTPFQPPRRVQGEARRRHISEK